MDTQQETHNQDDAGTLEPGTPEYDAVMIAKAEASQHPDGTASQAADDVPTPPQEDSLLAGKYKNEEELQKGILNVAGVDSMESLYKALEKGKLNDADKGDASNDKAPPADKDGATDTGNLYQDAVSEFDRTGELSTETRETLNKQGIPNEWIDSAIAGRQAEIKAAEDVFYEMAGGKEAWASMSEWAKDNMPKAEVKALNKAFASGDEFTQSLAIDKLKGAYQAGNNFPPQKQLRGNPGNGTASQGRFNSMREMVNAMKDPRYNTDPAYRNAIQRKVAMSNL